MLLQTSMQGFLALHPRCLCWLRSSILPVTVFLMLENTPMERNCICAVCWRKETARSAVAGVWRRSWRAATRITFARTALAIVASGPQIVWRHKWAVKA